MIKIVGVRFRNAGKSYYFDPKEFELRVDQKVIVETARGIEMGIISIPPMEVEEDKVVLPLKEIIRIATKVDMEQADSNVEKERDAYKICQEKIKEHQLEMKLVQAEYTFDRSKLLFYFTAEGRIDFRELVKDLASIFRTRIELRQIGVRDETKILGGIGICGRELCCKTFLSDFAPVSIKMAKEQKLSLNPSKISGVCGRLMCCLANEEETYEYLNKQLPKIGDEVETPTGAHGNVIRTNVLRQLVMVLFEEGDTKEAREYPLDELKFHSRRKKSNRNETFDETEALFDVPVEPGLAPEEVEKLLGEDTEADKKSQNEKDSQGNRNRNFNSNRKGFKNNNNKNNKNHSKQNNHNRMNKENKENKDNKENNKNKETVEGTNHSNGSGNQNGGRNQEKRHNFKRK